MYDWAASKWVTEKLPQRLDAWDNPVRLCLKLSTAPSNLFLFSFFAPPFQNLAPFFLPPGAYHAKGNAGNNSTHSSHNATNHNSHHRRLGSCGMQAYPAPHS